MISYLKFAPRKLSTTLNGNRFKLIWFNPNQVFNSNQSDIGTISIGSFRLTRFESLLADLHRARLETFSDCLGMGRISAEYTQKKFSLIQNISLNETNLCIAIRSNKSFFDGKKFLDCFISLNLRNKCLGSRISTFVMWFKCDWFKSNK